MQPFLQRSSTMQLSFLEQTFLPLWVSMGVSGPLLRLSSLHTVDFATPRCSAISLALRPTLTPSSMKHLSLKFILPFGLSGIVHTSESRARRSQGAR